MALVANGLLAIGYHQRWLCCLPGHVPLPPLELYAKNIDGCTARGYVSTVDLVVRSCFRGQDFVTKSACKHTARVSDLTDHFADSTVFKNEQNISEKRDSTVRTLLTSPASILRCRLPCAFVFVRVVAFSLYSKDY